MSENPAQTAYETATGEQSPNGTAPPAPPPATAERDELLRQVLRGVQLQLGIAIGLELLILTVVIVAFRTR